jgi:hypothetical protein
MQSLLEEAGLRDVPDTGTATIVRELPAIVDAANFLKTKIETPAELVAGVLHQGSKLVLGGASKSNKTWNLIDLALSVGTGGPWLSVKTSKARVLLVNFELPAFAVQARLKAVAHAKGIKLGSGVIDLWNLRGYASSFTELFPQIVERAKDRGYGLIILDPIYKLYGTAKENSADEMAMLMNAIEALTVATGAAVAFGAHYSKGNQAGKEAIDRISGSGVFARDPDSILNFTRHQEAEAFTVELTLRNFKPVAPFCVRWAFPLMRRDDALDPAKLKQSAGRPKLHTVEKILECLGKRKLNTAAWQKKAGSEKGVPKTQFFQLLDEAKRRPGLSQTPQGKWFYEAPKEQKQ